MAPFLETARLILRPFTPDDTDRLLTLDNDPDVMRFINGGKPTTREALRTLTLPRLLHDYPCFGCRGYWATGEKTTGAFVGWFEYRPLRDDDPIEVERGYRLAKAAWGRGYATEGPRALTHNGFTGLGVERVTANTMAVNIRSRRVMEKVGLSFCGSSPGTGRRKSRAPNTVRSNTHSRVRTGRSGDQPRQLPGVEMFLDGVGQPVEHRLAECRETGGVR